MNNTNINEYTTQFIMSSNKVSKILNYNQSEMFIFIFCGLLMNKKSSKNTKL